MVSPAQMDRRAVHADYERARDTFHRLLEGASATDLGRPTEGPRWTNEQLLWHMLFGYVVVRALLVLVRFFGRLPPGVSRAFAWLLNAGTVPFDLVNYLGPVGAVKVCGPRRMAAAFDRVTAALLRRLDRESETDLARGMHYPVRWDPFFTDFMTLADIYRYPTQHFDFHRRQPPSPMGSARQRRDVTASAGVGQQQSQPGRQPQGSGAGLSLAVGVVLAALVARESRVPGHSCPLRCSRAPVFGGTRELAACY